MSLWNTINMLCDKLPKGFIVKIGMENGSAWVELYDPEGNELELPDSTDKNLGLQLADALSTAKTVNNPFSTA